MLVQNKYEPPPRPRTLSKVCCGGWWWSKGVLEFRFGPNLGLRLEAGTDERMWLGLAQGVPRPITLEPGESQRAYCTAAVY